MKRTYQVETSPARIASSPRTSPTVSTFGATQSPINLQHSNRTLPSPTSYTPYPSSTSNVLNNYTDIPRLSPQTAHVQDLQHQISTKTLALQTLQREHDRLLAALSRSQTRCETLDKKSQVSDHEINTLSEEKVRLEQRVRALEAQVNDLSRAKEDAQRQLSADGAQWQRIVAMSSELQTRSTEEKRKFESERATWERDRDVMERRIRELEARKPTSTDSFPCERASTTNGDDDDNDAILTSASLQTLRAEIVRLRRHRDELEALLRDIQGETELIGPTLATLTNLNERISALTSKTRYDSITGPQGEGRRAAGGSNG